ncbi:hypothetical protein [Mastigocoleus sp. MO_188.B34]|uniref:hypothetical protein n=1 Tax=Mastigocoleus sp. MO_188.B34 TaxID=3036635 RepID=UPI00260D5985|nr:hypothetical protein [Mastigocoleus sp. MO_188.B34]MDJ0694520.1 hypothetical protein [Mastigocoleus sp. MO_188.B34]
MSTTKKESKSVEVLHGLVVTETEVIITVTSTGCTDKSDFEVSVQESLPLLVTFKRIGIDPCRTAPLSVDLSFSRKEVGIYSDFKVTNPFASGPNIKVNA